MVSINYATREVTCKIVYYGPGLSGKTTNLLYVHKKVPATTRGKMISLATEADRTLYFDFLPINIGTINGFAAKFQLYTVPGQVYYNATRKLVLRGVDGLVFVADSQAEKMDENIESLTNLKENLEEYGYNLNDLPIVIQYNKRDLPGVLTVPELEAKLNPSGWISFEAEAVSGKGVFDTLKMIIKIVLEKAKTSKSAPAAGKAEVAAPAPAKPEVAVAQVATPEAPADSRAPSAGQDVPATASVTVQSARRTAYQANDDSGDIDSDSNGDDVVEHNVLKEDKSPEQYVSVSGESAKFGPAGLQADTVDAASSSAQRPFPGSAATRVLRRDRRITVSDFQPATREEQGTESRMSRYGGTQNRAMLPTPAMAPAKRLIKKKPGFFKRLFGIK